MMLNAKRVKSVRLASLAIIVTGILSQMACNSPVRTQSAAEADHLVQNKDGHYVSALRLEAPATASVTVKMPGMDDPSDYAAYKDRFASSIESNDEGKSLVLKSAQATRTGDRVYQMSEPVVVPLDQDESSKKDQIQWVIVLPQSIAAEKYGKTNLPELSAEILMNAEKPASSFIKAAARLVNADWARQVSKDPKSLRVIQKPDVSAKIQDGMVVLSAKVSDLLFDTDMTDSSTSPLSIRFYDASNQETFLELHMNLKIPPQKLVARVISIPSFETSTDGLGIRARELKNIGNRRLVEVVEVQNPNTDPQDTLQLQVPGELSGAELKVTTREHSWAKTFTEMTDQQERDRMIKNPVNYTAVDSKVTWSNKAYLMALNETTPSKTISIAPQAKAYLGLYVESSDEIESFMDSGNAYIDAIAKPSDTLVNDGYELKCPALPNARLRSDVSVYSDTQYSMNGVNDVCRTEKWEGFKDRKNDTDPFAVYTAECQVMYSACVACSDDATSDACRFCYRREKYLIRDFGPKSLLRYRCSKGTYDGVAVSGWELAPINPHTVYSGVEYLPQVYVDLTGVGEKAELSYASAGAPDLQEFLGQSHSIDLSTLFGKDRVEVQGGLNP